MFSCEFCEISHKTFFNKPVGQLLLYKHSFCLLSHHAYFQFNRTSAMEYFCENSQVVKLKAVKYFHKESSIVDVWPGSKYASVSSHLKV